MANTRAQMDALWGQPPSGGASTGAGGGAASADPNDLVLRLADTSVSCDSVTTEGCDAHWYIEIVVPPEAQEGGVHDLHGPSPVYGRIASSGTDGVGGCVIALLHLGSGTLDLTAITPSQVDFVLTLDYAGHSDANGSYSPPRCP